MAQLQWCRTCKHLAADKVKRFEGDCGNGFNQADSMIAEADIPCSHAHAVLEVWNRFYSNVPAQRALYPQDCPKWIKNPAITFLSETWESAKGCLLGILFVGCMVVALPVVGGFLELGAGFLLVFALFPIAAGLSTFFCLRKLLTERIGRTVRTIIPVAAATVAFASILVWQIHSKRYLSSELLHGPIVWTNTIPRDLQGLWIEISDLATVGKKKPDVYRIGESSVHSTRFIAYTDDPPTVQHCTNVAVRLQGRTVRLFCPSETAVQPEKNPDFMNLYEMETVETSIGRDPWGGPILRTEEHERHIGRFYRNR